MKKMKRFMALVLATMMVLAMGMTSMAADETYSITINDEKDGHTYEAYKIFDGTLYVKENGDKVLSDVQWTEGMEDVLEEVKKLSDFANCSTAEDVTKALNNNNAEEFAKVIAKYIKDKSIVATASTNIKTVDNKYVIAGLEEGYYLVKDKDNSIASDKNDAYTELILRVVGDAEVTAKKDVPKVEKEVKQENGNYGEDAIYDIGDSVEFKLTGTLPSDYDQYATYYYMFIDTLSSGLTYNNDAKVTQNGEDITENFEIELNELTNVLTIECENLKNINGITATSKIIVTYTATLNANAKFETEEGNFNKVKIEFSNNPNDTGHGTTTEPDVKVVTLKLNIDKVDEEEKPLSGAGFTLYKWQETVDEDGNPTEEGTWGVVGSEIKDVTTFEFKGLGDGKYKIEETTIPEGYNKAEDVLFIVKTTYASDGKTIEKIEVLDKNGIAITDNSITFNATTGIIDTDIINKTGATLPETGGMGTTVLYIAGILAMAAAVFYFASRKRRA